MTPCLILPNFNLLFCHVLVVIDRKMDKNCDTGNFECIYKTNTVAVPQYLGMNLTIEGVGLKAPSLTNVAPRPRRIVVPETAYQSAPLKTDVSNPTFTKKEKTEKKRRTTIKMAHKDKENVVGDGVKGKKTPPEQSERTPTLATISETKSISEPSSAKLERNEGLLLKRKRTSSKSVEIPKSQLDLMKPTDSYLRKIKEGKKKKGITRFHVSHRKSLILPRIRDSKQGPVLSVSRSLSHPRDLCDYGSKCRSGDFSSPSNNRFLTCVESLTSPESPRISC